MARPIKEGLDYFPLDVDIDQDDKLVVPIGKFGMRGYGIIVRLMAEIYKNGHFYPWNEKEQFVFNKRINDDINFINDVVNECLKWGFFHHETFDKYHVLTSRGFQNRFIGASKRRKSVTFVEEYTLIDLEEACKKINYPIIVVNVNGIRINEYINTDKCIDTLAISTQREKEIENEKEIEKDIKDISAEIFNFRSRYSPELLNVLDSYLDFIAGTRKSKKISDGILIKIYSQFSKYSFKRVEYAIKTHLGNEQYSKAKEEYTFGIMRNTTETEAERKLAKNALVVRGSGRGGVSASDKLSEKNKLEKQKIQELLDHGRSRSATIVLDNS
jgi:hypothetical protein